MAQKPAIPKGTRDFSPSEMVRRNYIFDTIKQCFKEFGFLQIETPAMENLSTLMGKYGEEGDKLLFKILNSGDFLKGVSDEELCGRNCTRLTSALCEKGLRYDLTVPFARYVVQHRNDIQLPFKRFQIQPVWRADRPQKGRYREFYQCDADVVGSDSLINEIELLSLIDRVFGRLGVSVTVKLNNRKVLSAMAELIGKPERMIDITVAIDKLDKIGADNVVAEMKEKGLTDDDVKLLMPLLSLEGDNQQKLTKMAEILANTESGPKGVEELTTVINGINALPHGCEIELDFSLARGLNYYTGTIIEVKANDVAIGSISGGGRYDNLTGVFGLSGISGVGISFGADRIYDVMLQLNLFPQDVRPGVDVMFANFGDKEGMASLGLIAELRNAGFSAELYPDATKMKKQMAYADHNGVGFVAMIGETELNDGTVCLKNMNDGSQNTIAQGELVEYLKAAKK